MESLFFNYILTNWSKTVLYTGFTNNLSVRLIEHWMGEKPNSFTKRYRVFYLVWFETTKYVLNAINMEKQIKKYTRAQKEALIIQQNPDWSFLNETILGNWPPNAEQIALAKARKGLY